MQTNVEHIKAAALALEKFARVTEVSFSDPTAFPACVVGRRERVKNEAISSMHTRNRGIWRYQVIVLVRFDRSKTEAENWTALEDLSENLKDALVGTTSGPGHFYLGDDEVHDEALISGMECLIAEITVEADVTR